MRNLDLSKPATLSLRSDWERQRLQRPDTIHFETAAEAIKFAIESLDSYRLAGALLTTDGQTLTLAEMRAAYNRSDFPLPKGATRHG